MCQSSPVNLTADEEAKVDALATAVAPQLQVTDLITPLTQMNSSKNILCGLTELLRLQQLAAAENHRADTYDK